MVRATRTAVRGPARATYILGLMLAWQCFLGGLAWAEDQRPLEGDIIRIPVGQQPGAGSLAGLPRTGESRNAVLQRLGEPKHRHPAVGHPPISAWDYSDMVVYFEYDHVVHTVRKHRPRSTPVTP